MNVLTSGVSGFQRASRITGMRDSDVLRINTLASALNEETNDVISLCVGEPDFETPNHVKASGQTAMAIGDTKYTTVDGTTSLKLAIQNKLLRDNDLTYSLDEISVSNGAEQVIFNAFMASLNPGDEVIIPSPHFTCYPDIVRICGGVPKVVQCAPELKFRITAEQLEGAITNNTRWIMINSPSNPAGTTYSANEYCALLDVLARYPHVWLLSDELYEHIVFDQRTCVSPASLSPELRGRILTVNGVSKAFAMTGWRIGYGAGHRSLIEAMAVVQSQSTACPSSISQAAAAAALSGPQEFLGSRRDSFQKRRNLIVDLVRDIPELSCTVPGGTFYLFVSCADLIGKITPAGDTICSDSDLSAYLLYSAHVALVPGSAFGSSPFFRISFAKKQETLVEAMERLKTAIEQLS